MKKILLIAVITLINFKVGFSQTQLYLITNVAGNGVAGYSGNGGQATAAELNIPYGIATVPGVNEGEIFISDRNNQRVRTLLSPDIFNFAGNGVAGYSGDGGQATAAELNYPYGVAEDASGNVYIADYTNERIRKVNTSGVISTFAGNGYGAGSGFGSYSGDGGQATAAELNNPIGVAVDGSGIVYIADLGNHRIRKVGTGGVITTIAGNGSPGYNGDNINATAAELNYPEGVAVDASNNLYIADYLNQRIRKVNLISPNIISTVAGNGYGAGGNGGFSGDGGQATAAELNLPNAVTADASGNIYIADNSNERVRMVNSSGVIYTIAGNGTQGFNGDFILGTDAELDQPSGVAAVGTNIYVVDFGNSRVRELQLFTCTLTEGTPTVTNVSCNGGTNGIATATPSGGTSPYTYSWTGGGSTKSVSNLSAGTYSVTVTDIVGCTASSSVTVTQPSVPLMTEVMSVINPACFGETGSIAATQGTTVTKTFSYEAAVQNFTVPNYATSLTVTVYGAAGGSDAGGVGTNGGPGASFTGVCQVIPGHVISVVTGGVGGSNSLYFSSGGGGGSYVYDSTLLGAHSGTPGLSALFAVAGGGGGAGYNNSSGAAGGTNLTTNDATNSTVGNGAGGTGGNGGVAGAPNCSNGGAGGAGWISNGGSGTVGGGEGNYPSTGGYDWANNFLGGPASTGKGTGEYGGYGGGGSAGLEGGGGGGGYNGGGGGNDACTYGGGIVGGGGGGGGSYLNGILIGTASATNSGAGDVMIMYQPQGVAGGTSPYTYSWSGGGGTTNTVSGLTAGTYTLTVTDNHGCTATASATLTQPALLGVTIASVSNISCNGGMGVAAANTPTGGTSPYTYSWSGGGGTTNTASGITAGTYTLTVTDNHGCTAITSANITQPAAPLSVSIQGAYPDICDLNGIIAANAATGGTPPYTYSWSPSGGTNLGINNVPAGSYTITVTDYNHCTNTASIGLSPGNPPVYVNVATVNNISCYGGTGSATVNTNVFDVQYGDGNLFWLPSGGSGTSASNLSAGTYTVNVSAQGGSCFATCTVTITQPAAPLGVSIASVTNGGCSIAGSATANAATGGIPPYTYSWSPSGGSSLFANGLSGGTFTITATDNNGCAATASATITQSSGIGISLLSVINPSCNPNSGSITFNTPTGGTPPYTYAWIPSGGNNLTATGLSGGSYTIIVFDNSGCLVQASATITQSAGTLKDTAIVMSNATCYGTNNGSAYVNISAGASPFTYSWSNGVTVSSISGLSAGTYSITVEDNNGCSSIQSITIKQPAAINLTMVIQNNVSCYSGSNGIAKVGVSGGTVPYTYSWSNGSTTYLANNLGAGTYTLTASDKNGCSISAAATITQPVALGASVSITYPNCVVATGSASVSVTGGTLPYVYTWSPPVSTTSSATGLALRTYVVSLKDAHGCTSALTFIISQPPVLRDSIIRASVAEVPCGSPNSGSATAGTKYGTQPYTYSWTNGNTLATASGLSLGTYTVTVRDANACSAITSVTITQTPGLTITTIVPNNVSCNGGTNGIAKAAVSGGVSPYTYSWSPGGGTSYTAYTLSAGIYTVSVTDKNGCNNSATATITQPVAIRDSVAYINNATCHGGIGSAGVGVKGGTPPYAYIWSPPLSTTATATGLTARTYVVSIKDADGCAQSLTFSITQPLAISLRISSNTCSAGSGTATVGVTGGASPYTYSWSPNVNSTATASGLTIGTYTITVTDNNGCSNSIATTVTCPPGIVPHEDNGPDKGCCSGIENITLYPNPNSGQFTIAGVEKGMVIEVYDYTGRKISVITANNETMQLNISNQSNGLYLIRITDKDGNLVSQKKVVKTQ